MIVFLWLFRTLWLLASSVSNCFVVIRDTFTVDIGVALWRTQVINSAINRQLGCYTVAAFTLLKASDWRWISGSSSHAVPHEPLRLTSTRQTSTSNVFTKDAVGIRSQHDLSIEKPAPYRLYVAYYSTTLTRSARDIKRHSERIDLLSFHQNLWHRPYCKDIVINHLLEKPMQ